MKTKKSSYCVYGRCLLAVASMLMVIGNVRASYESTVLDDHPLAYYPLNLDVDTGTKAADLSGNGLDGDLFGIGAGYNNVPGPSPYITNGVSFDGQSTIVYLPNSELLNFEGRISLEAWVQPAGNSGALQNIIAKGYDANYNEIELRQSGNFYQSAGGGVSGLAKVGVWSHVVSTYDGTHWNLYVDGVLVKSNPSASGAVKFAPQWVIGTGSDLGYDRMFAGNICQVAIYNVGLTPDQVKLHYYTGKYGGTNFAPAILSAPAPVSLFSGGNARFGVTVESALPVTYQWYKGASLLSGQTNAALVLTNVQISDAGSYNVAVANTAGLTSSTSAILTVLAPGVYGAVVMADKPLAFYPLTESSGSIVTDYANGFNGTYENSPVLGATGPSPYITAGVSFSGANGQIANLGNSAEMNISGLVSMEAWVQAGINDNGYIVAHGLNMSPTIETELKATSAGFNIEEYGVYYKGAIAPYQSGDLSGNWVHLVGSWDGTNWNIYRNGVLMASTPSAGGVVAVNDCPWAIGGSGTTGWGGRNFKGVVSQVAIYDHPLTQAQVLAHYHMGSIGTTNPPPIITSDLTARSIYVGGTLHLTAVFDSAMPVSYTWYKGASVLTGQTNVTLVLTNVQAADAGNYKLTGTSQAGSATSAAAQVTVLTPGFYGEVVMADKPFAYYPLNESSGTSAVDYAGAFNGTYQNSPGLNAAGPSSYISSGVLFTRASHHYVDLANYIDLMNFGGPIAMEAWVLPNGIGVSGPQDIIAKGWMQNPVYSEIVLRANGNDFSGGDVHGSVGGALETADWTHLVSTYDGTNWMLFRNGALVGTATDTNGIAPFKAPWAIGSGSLLGADRYFDGTISQVALYKHSLTPAQAAGHYQMGAYGSNLPPSIASQPIANTVIYSGGTIRLTVNVVSAVPVAYAWYKGDSLLPDQTNSALVFAAVQTSDSGTYHVTVTSQLGSVTSADSVLSVVSSGVYGGAVIADKPLAYYPLNETSGTIAVDYTGHGFNGTYANSPQLAVSGPFSYIATGVNFDGTSQKVVLDSHSELNFSGKITMEAWVKPASSSTWGDIIAKGYDGNNNYAELVLRANNGNYYAAGNGDVGGGTETTDWTYVVANNDGTNWNMYINGVLVSSNPNSGGSRNLPYPWAIASGSIDGANRYFAGTLSQVALYNYALTPSQVLGHYQIAHGSYLPPSIISEPPANPMVYVGGEAHVGVTVSSAIPVAYAWYKGSSPLVGQTNVTLFLTSVQAIDAGAYHVIATSQSGSVTSAVAALTVIVPKAYEASVIANNPLAYYPLNEISGNSVVDYSGHGFNGTYRNSPVLGVAGPSFDMGSAVSFSGDNGQIADLGNRPEMNISGLVSMEAWVQAGINDNGYIVGHGLNLSPTVETELRADGNGFVIGEYGVYYRFASAPYQDGDLAGKWVHVVGTWDGANWNIFRNGVLMASTPAPGGIVLVNNCPWAIGGSGTTDWGGRNFKGAVSQVAIYDHALTAAQVQAHFLAGQYVPTPVINSVNVSGGNLVFNGTNGAANRSYTVLTSTNIAAPMTEWTSVATNTFDANGAFSVINVVAPGVSQRFYMIKYQ